MTQTTNTTPTEQALGKLFLNRGRCYVSWVENGEEWCVFATIAAIDANAVIIRSVETGESLALLLDEITAIRVVGTAPAMSVRGPYLIWAGEGRRTS